MLGTVFSYQNTPSLSKIYFQLQKDSEVHKGQFVCIEHPLGKVIGMVVDIFRFNPYFENMTFESDMQNVLPTSEWNTTVVETKPLGILSNSGYIRLNYPPYPGSKVIVPESGELFSFLGFIKEGLHIGDIQNPNTNVSIDLSRLLQKHLALLAMSGAGKSYCVSVLIEELLNFKQDESLGLVLFDVHGEYKNFAMPIKDKKHTDFSKKVTHYDASKIRFALHSLDESLFTKVIGNISPAAYRELSPILRKLKQDMHKDGVFGFDQLREQINEKIQNENVKKPILGSIDQIENLGLFSKTSSFDIYDIVKSNHLTIIDMSSILDMTHKHIIVAYFANQLFKLRLSAKIPPFTMILEEAHQFVPEGKSEDYVKARSIIETIAREGRKFGASLCLISQRPISLSTTVLSQCNTHLLMRITNPYDLDHIKKSSESLDSKSTEIITSLNVGEALLVGSAVNYPLFFKVRQRTSQPNEYEKNLQQMVKDFVSTKNSKDEELDSYL